MDAEIFLRQIINSEYKVLQKDEVGFGTCVCVCVYLSIYLAIAL